jgi:hypothetical protein
MKNKFKDKAFLKKLSVVVIMVGGFGLIFLPQKTLPWYGSTVIALIGFILYTVEGGFISSAKDDEADGQKKNESSSNGQAKLKSEIEKVKSKKAKSKGSRDA